MSPNAEVLTHVSRQPTTYQAIAPASFTPANRTSTNGHALSTLQPDPPQSAYEFLRLNVAQRLPPDVDSATLAEATAQRYQSMSPADIQELEAAFAAYVGAPVLPHEGRTSTARTDVGMSDRRIDEA